MTTHWTAIRACAQTNREANHARAELCRTYWHPVYVRLRRLGHSDHDAEDLAQDFFAYILERPWFSRADQNRGRFRSFLLTSLNHFQRDHFDRSNALKRGGGFRHVSLNASEAEAHYAPYLAANAGPEQAYELEWAASVANAAWKRLETEFGEAGKQTLFDALKIHLTVEGAGQSLGSAAEALGMTESALKVNVHRLRKRYGALLRVEVARTVATAAEVDEEMRYLRTIIPLNRGQAA